MSVTSPPTGRQPVTVTAPMRVATAAPPTPALAALPRPRRVLVLVDVIAITTALLLTGGVLLLIGGDALDRQHLLVPLLVAASAPPTMKGLKLYVRAANRIASTEMTRIVRASSILAGVTLGAHALLGLAGGLTPALLVGATLFLCLSVGRQVFRDYLRHKRRCGELGYRTLVVGNGAPATAMVEMLRAHPDLGFEPVGVATTRPEAPPGLAESGLPHLGTVDGRDDDVLKRHHLPNGAIVVASTMQGTDLNAVVHRMLDAGMHVHVVQGLTGIASQRMFPDPLLTDSAHYVAPEPPPGVKPMLKRAIDLVVGACALVVLGPVMAACALAIRATSPGPVLFRQERVGKDGERFTVLKFRTMVQDAEAMLEDLDDDNHRDGPLFKLAADPRVTRVGSLLRRTSLDELPQLVNVLRGEMSLVGPRPALPHEVEAFDTELLERQAVKPGITGLWQVEARDEASFDLYRRYDLFYVRNWTVLLDLVILFRTAIVVLLRPLLNRRARTVEGATVLD